MSRSTVANTASSSVEADYRQALAVHGRGQLAEAEALCKKALQRQPRHADALHLLGVIAYQTGRHEKAVQLIGKAIAVSAPAAPSLPSSLPPSLALYHANRANALRALKRYDEAIGDYGRALALRPGLAAVHYNLAGTFQDLGRAEDALASYDRAIALDPALAEAHHGRGGMLVKLGRWDDALAAYDRAVQVQPAAAEIHFDRGNLLSERQQFAAAVAAYDTAVALKEDFAGAHYNRANALRALGQWGAALAGYNRVLAFWPKAAEAHHGRAHALYRLGRFEEALAATDQTIASMPNFAEAHIVRGDALLKLKRREEALASYDEALKLLPPHRNARKAPLVQAFRDSEDHETILALAERISALNVAQDIADLTAQATLPAARARHDLEQIAYLLAQGETGAALTEAHRALQAALGRYPDTAADMPIALTAQEVASICRFMEARTHQPIAATPPVCLNPANDWHAIEAAYFASTPEIVVIDDFLSAPALLELRTFCLAATVWKVNYPNGYLGAFVEDGFISPLHLRIAEDLRATMPRIFGSEGLEQLWGFKYAPGTARGINVHADFARVNLNFWITPDDANLDPASGGMIVYDVPPPPSWAFADYNTSSEPKQITDFLRDNDAGARKVPYRCNRAVLFNSSLFHETDAIHFKDGYENRRINVTYLFGNKR